MLKRRHLEECRVKYMVLVVIKSDIDGVGIRRREKSVPGVWMSEAVRKNDWSVGNVAHLTIAVAVELRCYIATKAIIQCWFVQ